MDGCRECSDSGVQQGCVYLGPRKATGLTPEDTRVCWLTELGWSYLDPYISCQSVFLSCCYSALVQEILEPPSDSGPITLVFWHNLGEWGVDGHRAGGPLPFTKLVQFWRASAIKHFRFGGYLAQEQRHPCVFYQFPGNLCTPGVYAVCQNTSSCGIAWSIYHSGQPAPGELGSVLRLFFPAHLNRDLPGTCMSSMQFLPAPTTPEWETDWIPHLWGTCLPVMKQNVQK